MPGRTTICSVRTDNAPVAQPDRVVASEAIGRGFESLQARQTSPSNFFYASSQRRKRPYFPGFSRFPLVGGLSTEGLFGDFFASLQPAFSVPVVGRPMGTYTNQ
jgi:hypothetical protein